MIELTQEQREHGWAWIDWLRDPNNTQARGHLKTLHGHCCLGGACELEYAAHPDRYEWVIGRFTSVPTFRALEGIYDSGSANYLLYEVMDAYGMTDNDGRFGDIPIKIKDVYFKSLAMANDSDIVSFADIADWLEENVYGPRDGGT